MPRAKLSIPTHPVEIHVLYHAILPVSPGRLAEVIEAAVARARGIGDSLPVDRSRAR